MMPRFHGFDRARAWLGARKGVSRRPRVAGEAMARIGGPDLTDRIMERLGYQRASRRERRIALYRRAAVRSFVALALVSAIYAGAALHSQSDAVRRPAQTTLPAALRGDLESVSGVSSSFRRLLTPATPWNLQPDAAVLPVSERSPGERREDQSRVPWSGLL